MVKGFSLWILYYVWSLFILTWYSSNPNLFWLHFKHPTLDRVVALYALDWILSSICFGSWHLTLSSLNYFLIFNCGIQFNFILKYNSFKSGNAVVAIFQLNVECGLLAADLQNKHIRFRPMCVKEFHGTTVEKRLPGKMWETVWKKEQSKKTTINNDGMWGNWWVNSHYVTIGNRHSSINNSNNNFITPLTFPCFILFL